MIDQSSSPERVWTQGGRQQCIEEDADDLSVSLRSVLRSSGRQPLHCHASSSNSVVSPYPPKRVRFQVRLPHHKDPKDDGKNDLCSRHVALLAHQHNSDSVLIVSDNAHLPTSPDAQRRRRTRAIDTGLRLSSSLPLILDSSSKEVDSSSAPSTKWESFAQHVQGQPSADVGPPQVPCRSRDEEQDEEQRGLLQSRTPRNHKQGPSSSSSSSSRSGVLVSSGVLGAASPTATSSFPTVTSSPFKKNHVSSISLDGSNTRWLSEFVHPVSPTVAAALPSSSSSTSTRRPTKKRQGGRGRLASPPPPPPPAGVRGPKHYRKTLLWPHHPERQLSSMVERLTFCHLQQDEEEEEDASIFSETLSLCSSTSNGSSLFLEDTATTTIQLPSSPHLEAGNSGGWKEQVERIRSEVCCSSTGGAGVASTQSLLQQIIFQPPRSFLSECQINAQEEPSDSSSLLVMPSVREKLSRYLSQHPEGYIRNAFIG